MDEALNIQWFPGHMTKAMRMMADSMKNVDAVCEIIDARIPVASRNPDIDRLSEGKPKLVIINRTDQADPRATRAWSAYFKKEGLYVLETDSKSGRGIDRFPSAVRDLLKGKIEEYESKGQTGRKLRVMIVGIPNVGKSTFINKVAKRKAAAASDKPGVTKGKQWISIDRSLELMDTPGVLWPRFDDRIIGEHLAYTGAVKDEILDRVSLAEHLALFLAGNYRDKFAERYKFEPTSEMTGYELLEKAADKRGFLISGGEYDLERVSSVLLDEFRGGKLGRITLEYPPAECVKL